jgi:hypothetical protein
MGALGTWGAVLLWGISAGVGMLQTWIYAESASMFPDKPGGISLYAHEGWRGRFSLVGPIGAFGYWIGWSVVLSIFGKVIGDLIQAQWFPHSTWSWFDGRVHVGLPHVIAIGCILLVWLEGTGPARRSPARRVRAALPQLHGNGEWLVGCSSPER